MFFATPHRGANVDSWADITTGIIKVCSESPESAMAQDIRSNSRYLQEISEDFRHMAKEFGIVSFYEEDKMLVLGKVVSRTNW
jgi:hypothetical protein